MPWSARYNTELSIVETVYAGTLTPGELAEAVHSTLELARKHGARLMLGDCTALSGGHSVVDLYFLIDLVVASGLAHELREALILPVLPASADNVRFWESTAFNRGLMVKLFDNREHAVDWLQLQLTH